MSMFKNTQTGDVTSVFGEVHDAFLTRADQELIFDDRDAQRDPLTEPLDVVEDEAAPQISEGKKLAGSQDLNLDADGVDDPKE